MRQPNLTHYSFPKQLLSKSLLCPMFLPFKSHQNPWWCLRSQNMTCHPMTKHLDQVFACLTNALTFLQPSPYLFPLFSRNIPTSFPDHSQFCPPSRSFPKSFPAFSLSFPTFFPTSSHGFPRSFPVLSPPLWFFLIHVFPNFVPRFPRSFLDLATCQALNILEPDSCGLKNKPIPDCFPGNPKVFPAHSVISLAKRFLDSIVILLVPSQTEAAPYWSSQTSDPKVVVLVSNPFSLFKYLLSIQIGNWTFDIIWRYIPILGQTQHHTVGYITSRNI